MEAHSSRRVAPGSRQIGWFVFGAGLVAAIFFGAQVYSGYVNTGGRILASDYAVFRFASVLLWQGDVATLFDPARFLAAHQAFEQVPVGFSPFPYPPSALWVVAPLKLLPNLAGQVVWLGATFALFAWLVCRRAARPWQAAAILLLAPGSIVNLAYGQNGFLTGALMAGGLLLLERRPIVAGLLLGLLSFKPQFGLLLPFVLLAGGHYRTFLTAGLTTVVLVLGSLALWGTAPWIGYFGEVLPSQRGFMEVGGGLALLTTPSVFMAGRWLGLPIGVDYLLQVAVAIAVVIACSLVFRQRSTELGLKAAVVMTGTFLTSPYCSSSDMTIVAAAQIIALTREPALDPMARLAHGLAWALPLLLVPAGLAHVPIGPIALGLLFYCLLRECLGLRSPIPDRKDRIAESPPSAP
jgi:alpha-1,2-mannosyltransferase